MMCCYSLKPTIVLHSGNVIKYTLDFVFMERSRAEAYICLATENIHSVGCWDFAIIIIEHYMRSKEEIKINKWASIIVASCNILELVFFFSCFVLSVITQILCKQIYSMNWRENTISLACELLFVFNFHVETTD